MSLWACLSRDARKAGLSGSEGAGAQQCAPATRPSFVERIAVNTGTVPVCPAARGQRAETGWARCWPIGLGRGGAAVVLRAGESPAHGEGRQRFRGGKEAAMPQDALPNGSALDQAPGRGRR